MRELGCEDEMRELLAKLKLTAFVELHEIISQALTLEFLPTLSIKKDHSLSFTLNDEDKTLTLAQLGEALKLPHVGHYVYEDEPEFDEYSAWKELIGEGKF